MANADQRDEQSDVACMERAEDVDQVVPSTSPGKVNDTDMPVMTSTKLALPTITTSTPRSSSITNAVTPGTTASSTRVMTNSNNKTSSTNSNSISNDPMASKSANDSFMIIDARSSSSENVVTASSMTSIPADSCDRHVVLKGTSSSQPNHFTFEEAKLPTDSQNRKHYREFAQASEQNHSIRNTPNSHLPLVTSTVPTSNRSRSPTITTSRRGGRSSPVTSSIRSSPPPPTNRSTPVHFSASSVTDHLHSQPTPSTRGSRQLVLPSSNFNNDKHHRYADAPSSVAAAAAAAAAATAAASSSGRYYIEGQYLTNRKGPVTPANGGVKNASTYSEGGRPTPVNEDNRFYAAPPYASQRPHPQHPQQRPIASGPAVNERYPQQPQHYFPQQDKAPFAHAEGSKESGAMRRKLPEPIPSPPPLYGQIHTFSASGSLRGSGDAQEQQGRFSSRNSYDNYMQIYTNNNAPTGNHHVKDQFSSSASYHHAHHQRYRSSPTTLPQDHDGTTYIQEGDHSSGAPDKNSSRPHSSANHPTRGSPNFTIYHNPTPRQSVPAFGKSGTVVLGGNTSIHITHNSQGVIKKYESEHGVGRSAFGRSSARSVFRNTTHYSNPDPSGNKSFAVNANHTHSVHNNKLVENKAQRQDDGYYREKDSSSRNAPSPSSGGGVSRLLTPSRQPRTQNIDGMVGMGTPSILDLPEDSPQRILLSFRTPSMTGSQSFDWRDGGNDMKTKQHSDESGKANDTVNDSSKKVVEVLSPPENRRLTLTQHQSHAKIEGAVEVKSNAIKTPTASPTRSLLNSSFSLSALPSPPHFTNSNGEQIEIANSFSLFNASSFDSLAAECPQLQRRDKGDDIISLSRFGSECRGFSKLGEQKGTEGGQESSNIDSAATSMKPQFSLGVDICMGIGTMPTVGMSRSNSGSMSLIDFGPMTSRTESFVEKRNLSNVPSIDGYAEGVRSPPKVIHQYSSQQRQQDQKPSICRPHTQPTSEKITSSITIGSKKGNDTLEVKRVHLSHNYRSDSYASNHSSSTNGSGPRKVYPEICIASCETPIPGFYLSLVRMRRAFEEFSFLLPGLKLALGRDRSGLIVDVVLAPGTDLSVRELPKLSPPSEAELTTAKRRVVAAVCAFGGSRCKSKLKTSDRGSIFRNAADERKDSITGRLREYDDYFSKRYYENEHRISWAFEETPPVISSEEEVFLKEQQKQHQMNGGESISVMRKPGTLGNDDDRCDSDIKSATSSPTKRDLSSSPSKGSGQPKMRYRCKLCGQPKQNHVCPYQQSLQRSIGVSVYPAVNAFTADEPGRLAPSLTEMNNFICENGDGSPDRLSSTTFSATPMRLHSSTADSVNSPSAFYSTPFRSKTGVPIKTNVSTPFGTLNERTPSRIPKGSTPDHVDVSRKRHIGQVSTSSSSEEALFVKTMELRPEQYRTVTNRAARNGENGSYCYPQLPLPYKQRKSLSDNLFSLSKEVQHLTDECAIVLKEAREKDMWDLAVSELMTQVLVVLHCPLRDSGFEGIKNYLLTLGIAC